jgi:hypothetical protein
MGRDPKRPTPDLFSTDAIREASPPKANATTKTAPRRHILPKDLPNAVKHLSDSGLDLMHAATLEEMKRRGRVPPGVQTDLKTLRHRFDVRSDLIKKKSTATRKRTIVGTGIPLNRGQLNAVRAAFKAGITPSRIARQFGLSQSSVRTALKSDESKPERGPAT